VLNNLSHISEGTSEEGDRSSGEGVRLQWEEEVEVEEDRRSEERSIFLRGRETLICSSRAFISVFETSTMRDEEEGEGDVKGAEIHEEKEGEEEVEAEEEKEIGKGKGDDEDKEEEEEKDNGTNKSRTERSKSNSETEIG
jgi:hypothetical protein